MIKSGINGFGRIGRCVLRVAEQRDDIQVVAINDLLPLDYMAYLLKYDSVHGRFPGSVEIDEKDGDLVVDGRKIRITAEKDPASLAWDKVGAD